ncbi:MAG: hypothetical protein LBP78_00740 [Acidaminococcales bacterium]|jgi:di/tricarboxylate transporter|nr:hypothetical protein [Acidaminococcales bacterium]
MSVQIFTLLTLVLAIFTGFKRKVNTGLVSMLLAFIVGVYVVGIPVRNVIAGFPTSLFLTLAGMTFLFAIAKVNGTLSLLAAKLAGLAGSNIKLLPIIFFIIPAMFSAIGPGPIVMTALMAPLAQSIAERENIPPILMACMVVSGSLAGGLSPLCPSGIIAHNLSVEVGVSDYTPIFLCVMIASTIQGIFYYFFFGGLKLKGQERVAEKTAAFSSDQKTTLVLIAVAVIAILVFKMDIGLTGFACGTILLLLYPRMQKEAIANTAWDTLLLISGVSVLIKVIATAGGIKTLIDFLSSIMTPSSSTAIMAAIAGLMSTVSSASGVVMPTLIPTSAGIAQNMGTVSVSAIVAAIVVGAHAVTYSPFSTLGALSLAAAGEKTDKDKLFIQLITLEIGNVFYAAVLGLIGFYSIAG